MLRLLFLSLIFSISMFAQKASIESINIVEKKDTARYYYYYSPRFGQLDIDYNRFDAWYTYVIDSTYFPGTERFPDGTYKRYKRAPDGKLLTIIKIAPRQLRAIFLSDTATYTPHWRGEIPHGE